MLIIVRPALESNISGDKARQQMSKVLCKTGLTFIYLQFQQLDTYVLFSAYTESASRSLLDVNTNLKVYQQDSL